METSWTSDPSRFWRSSSRGTGSPAKSAPALGELVTSGLIRVIDLVFVTKDADGEVVGVELADVDGATRAAFGEHVSEPSGLLAEEDITDLGAELPPNSSAGILLVEHVWAKRFRPRS